MFHLLVGLLSVGIVHAQIQLYTAPRPLVLSEKTMSLEDRYPDTWVNTVFQDNILLSLAYLRHVQIPTQSVDWNSVHKAFTYSFSLQPQEVFAFQPDILPSFDGKVATTMNTDFSADQGYKDDGYLYGDGVCDMATLLNWVASTAGLSVVAPSNHDFAPIPDIPRQYGTAIYFAPHSKDTNAQHNLYIQNTKDHPVTITIAYDGKSVDTKVEEDLN